MFKFIFELARVVKLTNSAKCALFMLLEKRTSVCYLSSFTVFASQKPFWVQNVSNCFSPAVGTLNFKIGGKKGLPIFKRNLPRLMGSCCHIKIWLV